MTKKNDTEVLWIVIDEITNPKRDCGFKWRKFKPKANEGKMMKRILKAVNYDHLSQVVNLVNRQGIKQNDIQQIVTTGGGYTLFYWVYSENNDEEDS